MAVIDSCEVVVIVYYVYLMCIRFNAYYLDQRGALMLYRKLKEIICMKSGFKKIC